MRDPNRIQEVMDVLTRIWKKQPDTRFNQLIHNLQSEFHRKTGRGTRCFDYTKNTFGMLEPGSNAIDLFNLEDDDWLLFLKQYLEQV